MQVVNENFSTFFVALPTDFGPTFISDSRFSEYRGFCKIYQAFENILNFTVDIL